MALVDNTFPQSGDPDDSTRFAQLIGQSNLLNHVESGLTITPDFANSTASVAEGVCFIRVSSDTAVSDGKEISGLGYVVQVAAGSVSLSSGENHIAVVPTYTVDDTNSITVYSTAGGVPDSALRIGVVDTSTETVTEYNRDPDGRFESLSVTGDISVSGGVFVNNGQDPLATESYVSTSVSTATDDSEVVSSVNKEISLSASSISGLDSAVDSNDTDISSLSTDVSNLQANKLDSTSYVPVSDVDGEVSVSATSVSGLDSAVDSNSVDISSNDTDISNLQSNKLDVSGGTMSGTLTLTDGSISASRSWVNSNADVPNADYADSAGDADTLGGNQPGDFSFSGHTHDSRYDNYNYWTIEEGDGEQTNIHSGQKLEIYGGNDLNTEVTSTGGESRIRISHNNTGGTGDINTSGATIIDALKTDGNGHVTNAWTRNLSLSDLGGRVNEISFDNIEDLSNTRAIGIDDSEGPMYKDSNGSTYPLWNSNHVNSSGAVWISGGNGPGSTPVTIGLSENQIDAGSVDGFDIQMDGNDTSGVINFKTN